MNPFESTYATIISQLYSNFFLPPKQFPSALGSRGSCQPAGTWHFGSRRRVANPLCQPVEESTSWDIKEV